MSMNGWTQRIKTRRNDLANFVTAVSCTCRIFIFSVNIAKYHYNLSKDFWVHSDYFYFKLLQTMVIGIKVGSLLHSVEYFGASTSISNVTSTVPNFFHCTPNGLLLFLLLLFLYVQFLSALLDNGGKIFSLTV